MVKMLKHRLAEVRLVADDLAPRWLRAMSRTATPTLLLVALAVGSLSFPAAATADNRRFNSSVASNVYTAQRQAGCTGDLTVSPQLRLAAQWHTNDVLANRALSDDIGSDGSTVQDRARNAGYGGDVAETVGINPALAISGIELIRQWYFNPAYLAIMQNCAFTEIGVWSENSLDRTVVVAVYGRPS